jgi:hypothetical protein
MSLLLALAACTQPNATPAPLTLPDLDGACVSDPELFTDVTAEVTAVPTVLRVRWAASEPVAARVIYAEDDTAAVLSTPDGATSAEAETLLLGLHPDRPVTLRVAAEIDGVQRCSDALQVRTGALPADLPATNVVVDDTEREVRGWHAVAVIKEQARYATILDADGQFVWAYPVRDLFRATLSRDGTAMLANGPAQSWDTAGDIYRIPLDGGEPTLLSATGIHTDFVELPDGTIASLGWSVREFADGTRRLLGDTIVELRPDGTSSTVFDLFDHVTPDLSAEYDPVVVGGDATDVEDWSHVNSIAYDEASDAYFVTGTYNHSVLRVDRATGNLSWTLTDDPLTSDWEMRSSERELQMPHSVQLVDDDTLLVFNRGEFGDGASPTPCAFVSELDLDATAGAATPRGHYSSDACVTVPFLGQARRIDRHNTVVNWTSAGRITQVDRWEDTVLQIDLGLGTAFGSGEWVESLY